jgi:ferredoxin
MINPAECMSCGACEEICPQGAISMKPAPNSIYSKAVVDPVLCIICGECNGVCPAE